MLYVVPGIDLASPRHPHPVVVTEVNSRRLPSGVWQFMVHQPARPGSCARPLRCLQLARNIGKTVGPDGSRLDVKGAIPDLDWVAWQDRKVVIVTTRTRHECPVPSPARNWPAHLRGRGALVGFLEWDLAKGKGIDDHLAVAGPDRVLDEISHVDFASSRGGETCYEGNRL